MASYNRVVLVGNLTRDPEVRYIPSGTAVCDIGLAVNDRVKRAEQWVDEVTFVDITLWARTAEIAKEYLTKGSSVLIEGRLKLDSWEKDGQKRSKLKVVAEKMQMLGSRGGGGGGSRGGHAQQQSDPYSQPAPQADPYGAPASAPADSYSSGGSPPPAPPADDIPF